MGIISSQRFHWEQLILLVKIAYEKVFKEIAFSYSPWTLCTPASIRPLIWSASGIGAYLGGGCGSLNIAQAKSGHRNGKKLWESWKQNRPNVLRYRECREYGMWEVERTATPSYNGSSRDRNGADTIEVAHTRARDYDHRVGLWGVKTATVCICEWILRSE